MKLFSVIFWAFCYAGVCFTSAQPGRPRLPRGLQTRSITAHQLTSRSHPAPHYFDQPIDHFPHSPRYAPHAEGTFKHRYFLETSYYKPGGPVFLYLGGESPIDGDTHLEASLITQFMKRFNGIGIVLENRYYGRSYPFKTSTTDELAYLTTEQVLADLDTFARNVKIPGHDGSEINAPTTPWILYGGSYSGAVSAFAIKTYPETFHGSISSSGVIHGQLEYPQWYDPIQKLAPQDCVGSINDIIDNIDILLLLSSDRDRVAAIRELKEIFGLGKLKDLRDFAQTIAFPLGGPFYYPDYTWQEIDWNPAIGRGNFFDFCDNVTNPSPTPSSIKTDSLLSRYTHGKAWKNLGNYAEYIKRVILPLCPSGEYDGPECFGTQHPSWWADTTNGAERSFLYSVCTEFGAYQAAHGRGRKSLIARVVNASYTQEWCDWAFPKGKYNSIPPTPDLDRWNVYGDFGLEADRLFYIDGSADPWKELCYHSDYAPPRSWGKQQEHLINGAGHVWDLRTLEDIDDEPQFIRAATRLELRVVEGWLKEFNSSRFSS
ncbi:peptidase S28 [Poronia punctata]|nr:peptidase S28 [Poronia punctata]